MKYKITNISIMDTAAGKRKADVSLQDENGTQTERVTIWGDFPNFIALAIGVDVEGDIIVKQNGTYTNRTLYPIRSKTTPSGSVGASRGNGIKAAQERKAEMIETAQNRKNDSIGYFNSLNTAIQFVNSFRDMFEIGDAADAFQEVLHCRDKFIAEWKKYDSTDITEKRNPF